MFVACEKKICVFGKLLMTLGFWFLFCFCLFAFFFFLLFFVHVSHCCHNFIWYELYMTDHIEISGTTTEN